MAETDAENRLATHEAFDIVDGVCAGFRITRAVGEEDAVRFEREHIFGKSLRRNDGNFASFAA